MWLARNAAGTAVTCYELRSGGASSGGVGERSGVPNEIGAEPNENWPPDVTPLVFANDGPIAALVNAPSSFGLLPNVKRCGEELVGASGEVPGLSEKALGEAPAADPNAIGRVGSTGGVAGTAAAGAGAQLAAGVSVEEAFASEPGFDAAAAAESSGLGLGPSVLPANEKPPAGIENAGALGAGDELGAVLPRNEVVDLPANAKPPGCSENDGGLTDCDEEAALAGVVS